MIPARRRYVVDELPRLVIANHVLTNVVAGYPRLDFFRRHGTNDRPGFCLVEWDIAYSHRDREIMEEEALLRPYHPCVAPYLLYPISTGLPRPVWAHSHGKLPGERWITTGEEYCDYFGFGMVYLPWALLDRFVIESGGMDDPRLNDTNFSLWYHRSYGEPVRVHWLIQPVHLHW